MAKYRNTVKIKQPASPNTSGRITGIEAVSYTLAIAFIGAVAAGWFDAMVPWK
jgi:hypothetical protein